jgi:glycosyltransferase involved in cell wall biosynthesis
MVAPTSFFADYGCHVRILEEARALQRLGHRVTVVTYRNGRDLPEIDIRRTLPIPWRRHYEVGSSRHKVAFDALLGIKTLGLLLTHRHDVIHAHLHEGALIGQVLGKLLRIPVVFDFQGSLTEEMIDHRFLRREGWVYPSLRRLEQWIDRSSAVIFTSSTHAERILTREFGCDPARIVPLPDSVNTHTFKPATEFDPATLLALRQRLGIPADARVIVYLGLLSGYQGTDILLEAMQMIRRRSQNVYLLLMGFPDVDYYQHRTEELGIRDRVVFTGRVLYEQAPMHLALGDVAVSPKLSLTESAGKLLNYMALGLPTVAFDTPVAREYLGAHGIYAERGNADSLSSKLFEVIAYPDISRAVGERLRRRVEENFDWNQLGERIVRTYDSLSRRGQFSLS